MNAQMEEGLPGYALAQGQVEGVKRGRKSSTGGRADPNLQAPEQAGEDEAPVANHPRIQQEGSDNEQER